VWAAAIVMDRPFKKDAAEMLLAEWDQEIQTFPSNGSNQALAVGVRFRATNRCFQDADTETGQRIVQAR